MSTSERGFSLIEILVALVISLLLALAVAPLWFGLESSSAHAADRATVAGQSRVALARLERDLRTAVAEPLGRADGAAILRATPREVVLLVRAGSAVDVVEWEVVGGALMRRCGPWLTQDLASLSHSWYSDHKTMLQGLLQSTDFSYLARGTQSEEVDAGPDRAAIEVVRLIGAVSPQGSGTRDSVVVRMWARVGR